MKKILFFSILLITSIGSFAQTNVSKKDKEKSLKKAEEQSNYVSNHMKMNSDDKEYLFNTLNTRYLYIATYAAGDKTKDEEYKQAIYKKAHNWTLEELNKYFSKAESEQIMTLMKAKRIHDKKNKKK